MREIKFRAWIDGKMYYHSHGDLCVGARDAEGDPIQEWSPWVFDIPLQTSPKIEDIMQFTGLKDKNGKEIYEGDIVKIIDGLYTEDENGEFYFAKKNAEVYYFIDSWKVRLANGDKWDNCGTYEDWSDDVQWTETEIIGNIYENPNLIK